MSAPLPVREFDVTARSTEIFGRVLCSAREHHFIIDGPKYNKCPGEEITPPEAFLSSVAACGVELVHVIASEAGKKVGAVRCDIHGTVDRSKQARTDVTTWTSVRLSFHVGGTDSATAAELVEGFKRR